MTSGLLPAGRLAPLPSPVTVAREGPNHAQHKQLQATAHAGPLVAATITAFTTQALTRHKRRSRRCGNHSCKALASDGNWTAAETSDAELELERDKDGRPRLCYRPEGWKSWSWRPEGSSAPPGGPFECSYIVAGPEAGQPVVLVHGFGASSYHWRYQIPVLAEQGFRVYALCLLGFGWSPRVIIRYSAEVWASQVNAFIREVVGGPVVLAGNSIGAFNSLVAAATEPKFCKGLVLLNAAGRFEERQSGVEPAKKTVGDTVAEAAETSQGPLQWLLGTIVRAIATFAFVNTKLRIKQILEQVYVNNSQVDDELEASIRAPADHPLALDTFGEVIQAGRRTDITVFEALDRLPTSLPILLLWGMSDPWMRPARAEAIIAECSQRGLNCTFRPLDAGHCPHDDAPDAVNNELVMHELKR
eukprot:CAMPEP_0172938076 /NCGR_PEP_ID=MMETSP1075-20121228/222843_1 /TAXON_ID=2916 /ORGANISM="Ceratium fusus, Strain PA161109" /LENGTH=416 /DNA_ID=CAMNT_0013799455 /DNA_START=3 /DNA_END=1253 /DNA_ORIENTATION=-